MPKISELPSASATPAAEVAAVVGGVTSRVPMSSIVGLGLGELSGLGTSRYYALASDPLAAATAWTVCAVGRVGIDQTATGARHLAGSMDADAGGGGWSLGVEGSGSAAWPDTVRFRVVDSGGTYRSNTTYNIYTANKLLVMIMRYNGAAFGSDTLVDYFVNGARVGETYVGGVTGAITAGGVLTLGTTDAGAFGDGMLGGWLHGGAYATRAITDAEIREVTEATLSALALQDIPGGGGSWAAGWRADGSDPGATWAPFVGSGSLARTGTAATPSTRPRPSPL